MKENGSRILTSPSQFSSHLKFDDDEGVDQRKNNNLEGNNGSESGEMLRKSTMQRMETVFLNTDQVTTDGAEQ